MEGEEASGGGGKEAMGPKDGEGRDGAEGQTLRSVPWMES